MTLLISNKPTINYQYNLKKPFLNSIIEVLSLMDSKNNKNSISINIYIYYAIVKVSFNINQLN